MADEAEYHANTNDRENSPEGQLEKPQIPFDDCPEGGARGWAVALGCSGLLFCTFGFANAFGYALLHYTFER